MKFIIFFSALLLPALSFLPCADDVLHKECCINMVSLTASSHQHNDPCDDGCSPFCHCACCAGMAIQQSSQSFSMINCFLKNASCLYLASDIMHVASKVWQPPRSC